MSDIILVADTPHLCYLLKSINTNRTYIGYSNNLGRRIRQHNGEIVGGAKSTRIGKPWKIIGYISGFPDKSSALKFEWKNHNLWSPRSKYHCRKSRGKLSKTQKQQASNFRKRGLQGRIETLYHVLSLKRWTSTSYLQGLFLLTMNWLEPGYSLYNQNFPPLYFCQEKHLYLPK